MRMRLRPVTGAVGLLLVAAGCSSPTVMPTVRTTAPVHPSPSTTVVPVPVSTTAVPPGPEVVSATGVGSFQFGVTTEAQVEAVKGFPEQRAPGSFHAPNRPDYLALGYGCGTSTSYQFELQVNGRYCATVYFVNTATGTLAAFITNSVGFQTAKGTVVGTGAQQASQREGLPVVHGCYAGIEVTAGGGAPSVLLDVALGAGGQPTGPVIDIRAEATTDSVGLLFC